jgi:DNA-binding transcriptional ArsR family regulator
MDDVKQNIDPKAKTPDEITEEIFANPVKRAILELLNDWNGCFFGDIIENIDFPYDDILQNLLELKNMGIIKKSSEPSKFMIV